jgi:hypothetical protein
MTPSSEAITEEMLAAIPGSLCTLNWRRFNPDWHWYDCDTILAAVPVMRDSNNKHLGWLYEFSVVKFRCDEDYFAVHCEGEPWGWSHDDIELFVLIRSDGPYLPDPSDEAAAVIETREQKIINQQGTKR